MKWGVFALCLLFVVAVSADTFFGNPFHDAHIPRGSLGRLWKQNHPQLNDDGSPGAPVIIIPGLLGSSLEDKLSRAQLPALCLSRTHDWERIWIQPSKMLRINCFQSQLIQTYDSATNTYYNTKGVEVRPVDFGGVKGVDYVGYSADGEPIEKTAYMASLVANLEGAGYIVGKNLAAAPYDWRRTSDPSGWNAQFKALVEKLYADNGNTPVYTICHSMGNLEFTSFMETVDQAWKDQYIGGFISAAAPWSGASGTVRTIISGTDTGLPIDPMVFANVARTFGSMVWMLPTEEVLGDKPVVTTNTTSYTSKDLLQLFSDIGAKVTSDIYRNISPLSALPNPNVPTYCLYGTNVDTEISYEYANGLNEQPTTIFYERTGDGTVPIQSLLKCLDMNPVASREFNLLGHTDLVRDPAFFEEVMRILSGEI